MKIPKWLVLPVCAVLFACADEPTGIDTHGLTPSFARKGSGGGAGGTLAQQVLGEKLFGDKDLSVNKNQSCQTCHEPSQGFAAPLPEATTRGSVVEGSVSGEFGDRKPPSAAYAAFAPLFTVSGSTATGGNFWDGRATGAVLGNPAADQAMGPFLNPKEQALPDEACVVYHVKQTYSAEYAAAFGSMPAITFASDIVDRCASSTVAARTAYVSEQQRPLVTQVYRNAALAIAVYEGSAHVSPFDSKFDRGQLSTTEQLGAKLFGGKGKCQQCHENRGEKPIFSDFKYHNLGVPRNPENPMYGTDPNWVDPGLGGFTGVASHLGKFRTPTVRNAAKGTRTYMHNGVLTSLKQVVDFYNTRDVLRRCTIAEVETLETSEYGSYDPDGSGPLVASGCWPAPEYDRNLDTKNMGNLGLTEAEVDAIVAYITAMTDL